MAGILRFHVRSDHAIYTIEGVKPLANLLHEIEVIERIRRNEQGSGFFDGASASVEATATGLENLVTHPVDSAKGIGKAAGKIGSGIAGLFREKETGEQSSFGEKLLGSNERELAKQFGVDVYTTNPHLKELLQKMARARLGGKSAVVIIQLLIPVAAVASVALTAGSINGVADELVNDSSREELYRLNKEALLQMGWDESTVQKISDLSGFSPREQTYLRFYLERFHAVPGVRPIVTNLLSAQSAWEMRRELYELEMAAALGEKKTPVQLWDFPEGLAFLDLERRLFYFSAYDDLEKGLGKSILNQVRKLQEESKAISVEIYNSGGISETILSKAAREGIQTHAWAFFTGDLKK